MPAAYNDLQALKDDLKIKAESQPNIDTVDITSEEAITLQDGFNTKLVKVLYKAHYANGTNRVNKFWVELNGDGSISWWSGQHQNIKGGVPNPLTPSQRDPHFSVAQIQNGLNNKFPDWNVLRVNITVDEQLDRISILAQNTTTNKVIRRAAVVWLDSNNNPKWDLEE